MALFDGRWSWFDFEALKGIPVLLYLAPALAAIYLGLSLKFWFRIPAIGSAFGTACFFMGVWVSA